MRETACYREYLALYLRYFVQIQLRWTLDTLGIEDKKCSGGL